MYGTFKGGVTKPGVVLWRHHVVSTGVTGGYFQNGRSGEVLEGNTTKHTLAPWNLVATSPALSRLTDIFTRLHACARQKTGTMSVSIGDKIEVSPFRSANAQKLTSNYSYLRLETLNHLDFRVFPVAIWKVSSLNNALQFHLIQLDTLNCNVTNVEHFFFNIVKS